MLQIKKPKYASIKNAPQYRFVTDRTTTPNNPNVFKIKVNNKKTS